MKKNITYIFGDAGQRICVGAFAGVHLMCHPIRDVKGCSWSRHIPIIKCL